MIRANGTVIRCVSIILLICLCAGSVLYIDGFFEFTFIDRHDPVSTDASTPPINTTAPINGTTPSDTTARIPVTGVTSQVGDTSSPDSSGIGGDITSPEDNRFSPISIRDYIKDGYSVTYKDYTSDMVIAEVPLPQAFAEMISGSAIYRESVIALTYSDETFIYSELVSSSRERYTVETYMGYILITVEEGTAIYDYDGTLLFLSPVPLSPAYTRDRDNRPLYFTGNTTDFYYVDFEQRLLVLSDYNDEAEGRGLYFNYNPSFGVSDNKYTIFSQYMEYTREFSIDLGSSYKKSYVSHLIAKELYLMYPRYAELVARANKRFAAALKEAKKEIAQEEADKKTDTSDVTTVSPETAAPPDTSEATRAPEEITTPETTLSPETVSPTPDVTVSPDTVTDTPNTPEVTTPDTTASPEVITAPEVTVSPAESTTIPDVTLSPDTTISSDTTVSPDTTEPSDTTDPSDTTVSSDTTSGDVTTSPDTSDTSSDPDTTAGDETTVSPDSSTEEEVTVPEETTSKYPSDSLEGSDWVTKTFYGIRFALGTDPAKPKYGYKLARAYNFSGGRAAIVDDNRKLTFLNTSFKTAINGYKSFKNEIEGADQSTYFIRNYFEPLYNDARGLGHLYFDEGYVMVRCVEVQSMFRKIIGRDENILLDTSGAVILPPDGYTLVTFTEGIMVLERNGRYGYYAPDTQTWIAQPIYTYIEPFYEGIGVLGMEGGNIGAVDREGNTVIPFNYSYVSTMSTGLISVYSADYGWQVFAKLSK